MIPFSEVLSSPMGDFRKAQDFFDAAIELVDNAPEDILDLAREQLERPAASPATQDDMEDTQRQVQFKSLLRPGHYSYGSSSRVGRAFLKRYHALLG
jgi:hypothetical protein